MRRNTRLAIFIALVAAIAAAPTAALAQNDASAQMAAGAKLSEDELAAADAEIREYMTNHPSDWTGLDELRQELLGVEPLKVMVAGVDESLTAAEADAELARIEAVWEAEAAAAAAGDLSVMSVPTDAFTVSFSLAPADAGSGWWVDAIGWWNFRDDYVNGSDPDDVASIRLDGVGGCVTIRDTWWDSWTYNTVHTGAGYLYDAGVGTNAPIVNFNDSVSGFVLNVDGGVVNTRLNAACGPISVRGQFTYEHNQDGGTIAGISASWGGFSVAYNGSPSTLQKSSGIAVYP